MRKVRGNQGRDLGYPVLSLPEIRDIVSQIAVQDNHTLFLWTIDKFLPQTELIFNDYRLHVRLIWNKENGVAPGFTVRFSHEYLLWLYKGKFLPIASEWRGKYTTVLTEKATVHSRKPTIARKMIEHFYPNVSRIELFARQRFPGWDAWGNEVGEE